MKLSVTLVPVLSIFSLSIAGACAGEKNPPVPTRWGYAVRGADVEVRSGASQRRQPVLHLGAGALVTVFPAKSGDTPWTRVRAVDPEKFEAVTGWVESSRLEIEPFDQFPSDAELLKQLGGPYLEDIIASNTEIVRYVVHQGRQDPALVCFVGSHILPRARLQVFQKSKGKFVLGPSLEFAWSEMQSGITSLEVQDLVGNGNGFLVTHEPFSFQPDNGGVNLVIRGLMGDSLKTLWQAPLEFRNLASYPPQRRILEPPERNIGAPGTVTSGAVKFRERGALKEPVWKGKIESYVLGREEALDTVPIEKLCPWDGARFAPFP